MGSKQFDAAFLDAWETMYNPNFKVGQMAHFIQAALNNRTAISAQKFIEVTGAISLVSKAGRYGGTWAHSDVALEFLTWLDPRFKVFFVREFQRLKIEEARRASIEWPAERVKDLLDEARNWMEMIHPAVEGPEKKR